jgi:peptidyl-prolyl cis-trans isomerase B (cyclophilin B)
MLSFLLFVSCSEKRKESLTPVPISSTVKAQPAAKKPKRKTISDDNVVDTLLAYGKVHKETIAIITTSLGVIKIRLFKETPLHRANFIMVTNTGYFDSTVFSRVVPNFMAQGGSGYNGRHTDLKIQMGSYTVPAEFNEKLFHKKGAVAMAREYRNNPNKRSNPYAFYFVEGSVFSNETLDVYEQKSGKKFSKAQRDYYTKKPGAAHIDNEHTVFGEIIEGFDVVPKLTTVNTDSQDWPRKDLFILKVEIIK